MTQIEDGFTIVELFVLMVILGILAAIVVFALGSISDRAQASANGADMTNLQVGEETYLAGQKVAGTYATMSDLHAGSFLRSISTLNYICLRSDIGPADYFVVAGSPTGSATENHDCLTAAATQQPSKRAVHWTASNGTTAFP